MLIIYSAYDLIQYCKKQVGCGYWYGTFGQTASATLLQQKRKQFPAKYNQSNYKVKFESQFGMSVFDCSGLIKGFLWSNNGTKAPTYISSQDHSAHTFYTSSNTKGKTIDNLPNGCLLYKGTLSNLTHVGVYADGYVYEAKGHDYGVVKTKYVKKDWPYYSLCKYIDYNISKASTSYNAVVNTKSSDLNLRSKPNTSSEVLAKLPKNTKVNVLSYESNWYKVTHSNKTGYCRSDYLLVDFTVNTSKDNLMCRDKANLTGNIVTSLPKGAKIVVTSLTKEWAQHTIKSKNVYSSLKYLKLC